jgi:hypothetical protein
MVAQGLLEPKDEKTFCAHASKTPLLKSAGANVCICP